MQRKTKGGDGESQRGLLRKPSRTRALDEIKDQQTGLLHLRPDKHCDPPLPPPLIISLHYHRRSTQRVDVRRHLWDDPRAPSASAHAHLLQGACVPCTRLDWSVHGTGDTVQEGWGRVGGSSCGDAADVFVLFSAWQGSETGSWRDGGAASATPPMHI